MATLEWVRILSFCLFIIISIFLNYNSGNFKNIINLDVILTFTPRRPRLLNLEHPPPNLILNNPLHAKRLKLPALPQPHKLIHMGLHPNNKQTFPSRANVHKIQINAQPPPRQLSLIDLTAEHFRRDEKGMVCVHTLCWYIGEESICLSCKNKLI